MLGNYLIGLREGLEAALVIGILIAYLVRTGRQHLIPRVWAGVAAAVAISLAFGALLTFGPRRMADRTEELIAGSLSLLAVGFVTWMIFWMARQARNIKAELETRIDLAIGGTGLVVLALLAVGREGLEHGGHIEAGVRRHIGGDGGWKFERHLFCPAFRGRGRVGRECACQPR